MMFAICSSSQFYTDSSPNTEKPIAIPDFTITRKNSAETYVDGATVWELNFLDLILSSTEPIQSVTVDHDGVLPPQTAGNQIRLWLTDGLKSATITVSFAEGDRAKVLYVGRPVNVPIGGQTTNIVDGQTVQIGDIVEVGFNKAPEQPGETLEAIVIGVYRQEDNGVHTPLNSAQYSDDSLAGIAKRSVEITDYGTYLVRTVYHYTNNKDIIVDDWIYNPAPSPAPFESVIGLYEPEAFEGDTVLGYYYTDHLNDKTSVVLEVEKI